MSEVFYLSVAAPRGHVYTCVWQVTSENDTFVTMEVEKMEIYYEDYVTFGNGHEIYNGSSLIADERESQAAGTQYFFSGNQLWIVASSTDNPIDLEVRLVADKVKGQCVIIGSKIYIERSINVGLQKPGIIRAYSLQSH